MERMASQIMLVFGIIHRLISLSKKVLIKGWRSPLVVPILFILYHFKLWIGVQTLAADTGDGIGAFTFFSILPRYWNWYEGGGQPYWTEMAIYRLQDPLMWPFLLIAKALPIPLISQFNVYILLRLCLLGGGTYYLLKALKCKTYSTQFGVLIAMFGSAFSIMFRSIGALDLITAFVGMFFFGLRFFETKKELFGIGIVLVLLHSATTYHILYLVPVAILGCILYRNIFKEMVNLFLIYQKKWIIGFIAISAAFTAEYLAVKDPILLPVLRSMRYGTWVDSSGKVIGKEWGIGESVFATENLKAMATDCGTRFSCRTYSLSMLKTFLLQGSAWSLTGYCSLAGLFLFLLSVFYLKKKVFFSLQCVGLLCLLLAFGNQTPAWGFLQRVIPILQYLRHTGFYFHLFVFILCLIAALVLNEIESRMSQPMKGLFWVIVFVDLLAFQRLYVSAFLNFTKHRQLEEVSSNISDSFESRKLRIYNPYLIPRTSVATSQGTPSALESIFVQDQITEDHLKRGENSKYFGFITLFISKPMVHLRVTEGEDLNKFKERAGVFPYGVLTPLSERTSPAQVNIDGENLVSHFLLKKEVLMYLSVPFEAIEAIYLNGRSISFSAQEGGWGVLFKAETGKNFLLVRPLVSRRNLIYSLYYGAYSLCLFLYLLFFFRSLRLRPATEFSD